MVNEYEPRKKDISHNIRVNNNVDSMMKAIGGYYGCGMTDVVEKSVDEFYRTLVREGHIKARFDNTVEEDLAVKAAVKITEKMRGMRS